MVSLRHSKLHLILFTVAIILAANVLVVATFSSTPVSAETTESISINGGAQFTNTTEVQLTLVSSTAVEMQFSNDNTTWSGWEAFATLKDWNLTLEETASETVYVQFKDASNQTTSANESIVLDMVLPTPDVYIEVSSAENNELYFDGSFSYDNIGITSYVWNFGDGKSDNGSAVTHAFTENGTFYGNLTITDVAGNSVTSDFWVKLPVTAQATTTPTPIPAPTATPIEIRTPQPTSTPTTQPTPETSATTLSPMLITVIVAVIVIIVVGLVVILKVTRQGPAPPPAA